MDLAAYLRKPKVADTPAEALAEMARWQRAHGNSVSNGCQRATPFEYLDGILSIVQRIGSKDRDLGFILSRLRTDTKFTTPNWDFVRESARHIQSALQVAR